MTLARGSKGEEVKELQESLQSIGIYRGPIDGYYGKGTFEAVRNFQQRYLVDGIANDVTLDQIKNAVNAWKDNEETLFTVPNGLAEIQEVYGYIEYEDIDEIRWGKQAWIRVTNNWEKEYLVKANLPIVGDQIVNKNIVKSLSRVFKKIVDRGLDGKIKHGIGVSFMIHLIWPYKGIKLVKFVIVIALLIISFGTPIFGEWT